MCKRCQQRTYSKRRRQFSFFQTLNQIYIGLIGKRIVCPAHPVSYGEITFRIAGRYPEYPVSQHQNTAPGPPMAMAVEIPTMLPVPIVAASAVASAEYGVT